MNEILDALGRNLDREIEERNALLELVVAEGRILQSGEHRELERVLEQIRERLSVLGPFEDERKELLDRLATILGWTGNGPVTLSAIARHVGGTEGERLLERRDALRDLLRDTLARNRQNQYLLRVAGGLVADTLDLLLAGPAPTARKTYGPGGTTAPADRQGALFRARV